MTDTTDDELIQIDQIVNTWSKKMASSSDFQRLHNAISANLAKINSNTTDLENLVQKIGTPEDSEPLRDRYLRLQNETKSLMQQTNDALQQLKDIRVTTEADQRKKRTLVESLPKQYVAVMNRFQEAQRTGVRKERESLERARAVSYRQQGIGDSQFSDGFPAYSPQQQQQQVVLPMEQHVDMQALRERDDQLRQLETNIVQVNELFKDVAQLVHEQGGIIDSIENHVNTADTQVVNANKSLGKAVVYQSAARRKKIILAMILLVVLIVVGLILFFTLRK